MEPHAAHDGVVTIGDSRRTECVPHAERAHARGTVFVIDDDVSVRESLETLIRSAGWLPETFASAEEFLSRPRRSVPCDHQPHWSSSSRKAGEDGTSERA